MQIDDFLHVLTAPAPVGVPLAVGLASACGFAVANALQHRVAGTVPPSVHRAFAVLGYLVRRPQWLAATGVSFLAMLCHAFALRLGSIALVQPLMLVGVVLAVPLRAALGHERRVAADHPGPRVGAGRGRGRGCPGVRGGPPAAPAGVRGAARHGGRGALRRHRRPAQARGHHAH